MLIVFAINYHTELHYYGSFKIQSDFLIYDTAELEKEMKYFLENKNFKANFIKPKLRSWMDGRILKKMISQEIKIVTTSLTTLLLVLVISLNGKKTKLISSVPDI